VIGVLALPQRWALLPDVDPRRLVRCPWLTYGLVQTTVAIDRLRAWFGRGGLDAQPPASSLVRYIGDTEMAAAVRDALDRIAPAARDYVIRHAIVIGVGWSSAGWTGGRLPDHRVCIVVSGRSRDATCIRGIALHEMAHTWLESVEESPALSSVEDAVDLRGAVERRARILAAEWSAR